ncbi:MAG TPA: hypothetical protein HA354_00680 [Candidatus Poseidoniaceae archaeon]|nr:hypothetical protein [Candidatus Poseidoniaceae archaeon]
MLQAARAAVKAALMLVWGFEATVPVVPAALALLWGAVVSAFSVALEVVVTL